MPPEIDFFLWENRSINPDRIYNIIAIVLCTDSVVRHVIKSTPVGFTCYNIDFFCVYVLNLHLTIGK
jgi:hypothetical protein